MEVECCGLVSKQVDQVDLDLVANVPFDGRAGPLAVDSHKRSPETIRGSRNPCDVPVVCDDLAFGDGGLGVGRVWWEATC